MDIPIPSNLQTLCIRQFTLENQHRLHEVQVGYQAWGTLNERQDNVLVVCHALTGNTDLADWWGDLLGPGKVFDTDRYWVVCLNVLGSCYGTTGPCSINPETGKRYGGVFPRVTIRDSVRLHIEALKQIGVRGIEAVIGGSMGGMQSLEWAYLAPEWAKRVVVIAASGRHSAWTIGWSEAQRAAIYADPNWQNGHYDEANPPVAGLAAARMNAMISYRSWRSFQDRFGRVEQESHGEALYAVESYQRYQGRKLTERFDANVYVRLTQLMDSHDVSRGRGVYEDVLRSLHIPVLVVGIDSDLLYPLAEQEELARHIPRAHFRILHSEDGHDAFLIEFEQLSSFIKPFLSDLYPQINGKAIVRSVAWNSVGKNTGLPLASATTSNKHPLNHKLKELKCKSIVLAS
ncbi:MAG TPA: homoserine O-acetyltransferase [Rhodothermales bacterium]|nr:homoserine O-acetyltransferase [Rhodothermales bacterium]